MRKLHCDYKSLETLPEETAQEFALEQMDINGHQVYFVVCDRDFYGYSALVYRSGRILPHAMLYKSRFQDMYRSKLRATYIRALEHRLFTDDMLTAPLKDYEDYRHRLEYLHNDYGYQQDFVSIFYHKACVSGSPEQKAEDARIERESQGKIYDPVSFGWYADELFVRRHAELYNAVERLMDGKAEDYDFYFDAFKYEMYNHEYAINYWQGNWDTLSAFGKIEYDSKGDDGDLDFYFDQLHFTPTQRQAYRDAARYVNAHSNY